MSVCVTYRSTTITGVRQRVQRALHALSHMAGSAERWIAPAQRPALQAFDSQRFPDDSTERGDQLAKLNRRMAEMEERLRAEISRELHDVLGQSLTVVKLGLERAMRQSEREVMLACLQQSIATTDQAITSVRDLARSLRPVLLDEMGLTTALRALLLEHELHCNWEITLELDSDNELTRFTPLVETTAYRLVQEALTNALRHAHAKRVTVSVRHRHTLDLTVCDDGEGFDVHALDPEGLEHLGLIGMRERASAAGGTIDIRSRVGQGTTVSIRLPGEVRR